MKDENASTDLFRTWKSSLDARPLFAALCVFFVLLGINLFFSLKQNDGFLIYARDDAYIHMAMAKNLTVHGVWGVSHYGFTSSSSSIIWVALLGLVYLVTGVNDYVPFVINIVAVIGVVLFSWIRLKKYLTSLETSATLIAVVVFAPLPAMVFVGMEHSLHIFLSIAFLFAVVDVIETPGGDGYKRALLLAPLLVGTRYEGLFLVFAACCLLLFKKQGKKALLLGLLSLILVGGYGVYSVYEGWSFLPNSLLLKGGASVLSLGASNFRDARHVTALLALNVALFLMLRKETASKEKILILLFVSSAILHMVFASVGWFYRYEAYIVVMGIIVSALSLKKAVQTQMKTALLAQVLVLAVLTSGLLIARSYNAYSNTPQATNNVYSQQYQMGTFLAKYFSGKTVAANDIGAISYLADIRCVDLFGLATKEVADAKKANIYDSLFVEKLCDSKGVDVAVVDDSWFDSAEAAPEGMERVAKWQISNNIVCGDDTVAFYTVNHRIKHSLVKALEDFSPNLPTGCRYDFTEHTL